MEVAETGIPSLDILLGGGIPARQTVVITGEPGTGKTILASQIAFSHAQRGNNVVFATIASESHEKLLTELQSFGFFDPDRVGRELFVLSAYPAMKKGPKEAKELLLRSIRERNAKLLVIDGLRSVRDLWQDESKLRDLLYELNVGITQLGATGLLTTEYPVEKLMEYPEATTVDGIISLSVRRPQGRALRRAQVVKLRGCNHLSSEHVMHISEQGVHILPRLEETTRPEPFTPSSQRAAFGLPELDEMLKGGLPEKSTTLLVGSTGGGKTLLALNFVATGAKNGQPGILLTHTEPVERLVARAKGTGLDVEPLMQNGMLHIVYRPPINLESDMLIAELLELVQKQGAKRVVVDGIGELESSIVETSRARELLHALIVQLRNHGVTSVFIKEVPKLIGREVDFSDTPISITAENLLFVRHTEMQGRIYRLLSILKMRESDYDPYVRQFEITNTGIHVMDPIVGPGGIRELGGST
jgi:circadian clock protein KaiC